MLPLVLVHGAWHGAWCWEKIRPLLEHAGCRVSAPDLPGHGGDKTPAARVTLDSYVQSVCEAIGDLQGPVVLAGHSMAGLVISEVAEQIPDRIHQLVYLTAFLPLHGESLTRLERINPDSRVPRYLQVSADGQSATLQDDAIAGLFYHDCTAEDTGSAIARLCPQPMKLLETPVRLSMENFGSIPRSYVECSEDRALTPVFQQQMIHRYPGTLRYRLPASHSPFLSMPEQLSEILLGVCGR